ncbi:MAG: hypothetical protein KatS3mg077_2634 [Candidatus Binatia bacterium]|nr:MAG: hypothetical protein KatS3mg077_2634 [Candidatus Binatia bacterium]
MADKGRNDRIALLVREVENAAKQLRTEIRKRVQETGILKRWEATANQLRKQAAAVAAQVEKYAREVRQELEKSAKQKAKPASAKSKPASRPKRPAAKPAASGM